MPRAAAALLLMWMCLPAPAHAIVIGFSGTVDAVIDPNGRLDGSVAVSTSVTGLYEVDPTPSGGPFGEVGPARLSFTIGNYSFDESQDPHRIELNDDAHPDYLTDQWWTGLFVASQLDPTVVLGPVNLGFGARLELFDFQNVMIDGTESAPFVVESLVGWENPRLTLNALVDNLSGGFDIGDVQVSVALTGWTPVPEPGTAWLLAAGLVALTAQRTRAPRR